MSCSHTRVDRLRRACRDVDGGMRAFCVRDTSDVFWLTAFDGVFDEEDAHALLVEVADGGRVVLHTDSRYATACERAAEGTDVAVSTERASHAKFAAAFTRDEDAEDGDAVAGAGGGADAVAGAGVAADAADAVTDAPRLGIEDSIELSEYRSLEKACRAEGESPVRIVETHGLVPGLRAVKDADEVERLRAAQAVTDAAFSHITGFMRPGMTEREVQLELEDYMRRHGADGLAFPSIVATGANGASPHAVAGDTRLEAGQCVVLDFGARVRGYCSDMTRTVFLGRPEDAMRDAWDALRRANEQVEAYLKPGVTGKEAHELAERILDEGGFGGKMGHGLGHGVGIDIHEEPSLSPRNDAPLQVGNVVTVEPGIYLPGEFGMRLEDFGVVTEDGFDVFTRSTHDTVVV